MCFSVSGNPFFCIRNGQNIQKKLTFSAPKSWHKIHKNYTALHLKPGFKYSQDQYRLLGTNLKMWVRIKKTV